MHNIPVTMAELEQAIGPASKRPARHISAPWVMRLVSDQQVPGIDRDELLNIACEVGPDGPMSSAQGLLNGLRMRTAGDETASAMIAALECYLIPAALDIAAGR